MFAKKEAVGMFAKEGYEGAYPALLGLSMAPRWGLSLAGFSELSDSFVQGGAAAATDDPAGSRRFGGVLISRRHAERRLGGVCRSEVIQT